MPTCHCCGQEIKVGQAELTDKEKRRVNWAGPPENGRPNIIEAKRIKALAIYYGVNDWMAHWDTSLSPSENEEIFRKISTNPAQGGPTMKDIGGREAIRSGHYDDY